MIYEYRIFCELRTGGEPLKYEFDYETDKLLQLESLILDAEVVRTALSHSPNGAGQPAIVNGLHFVSLRHFRPAQS